MEFFNADMDAICLGNLFDLVKEYGSTDTNHQTAKYANFSSIHYIYKLLAAMLA